MPLRNPPPRSAGVRLVLKQPKYLFRFHTQIINMATLRERKRRGEEIIKKYRPANGDDAYASAVDAIADILLFVAESQREATQILHSAEIDFRNSAESESFVTEG
jgi:hypothetical protein